MKTIVKDIKWDTDGDQEVFDSLPQEIALPEKFSIENYRDDDGNYGEVEREARLEDISDWLSDEYGFCHGEFTIAQQYEFDDYKDIKSTFYRRW